MPTLDSIHTVAVLGLGTMGHGIAQSFATAGYRVIGFDEHPDAGRSLKRRIVQNLAEFVAAGLVDPADVRSIVDRISVAATEKEAVAEAQFVTEAVREDLAAKQELFERIESLTSDETILASNSSTFPITQSAARMKLPGRAIVTHWFNPPHIVPTVEVVPGPATSEETTSVTLALLRKLGKLAIPLRKELPGFLVNRVQIAVMREVWDLLEQGVASADEIDAAIRGSMGFRLAAVGPLQVHDFGGLDIQATVYRNLVPEVRSDTELHTVVRQLVEAGHYGPKTGKGFYEYTPATIVEKRAERDRRFLSILRSFYHEAQDVPGDASPPPPAEG